MKSLLPMLCIGAALALPLAASAQSADANYCAALSDRYNTYVLSSGGRSHNVPPSNVADAMSKCQTDAAAAIPVLEKTLQNAKISLPPRG